MPPKRKKVVPAEQPAETATEPTIEPAVDEALIGDAQAVLNAGNDLASLSEVELRELAGRAAACRASAACLPTCVVSCGLSSVTSARP